MLVRHGASADAVEGQDFPLAGGHGDPALSELGRRQAQLVCDRLATERTDAIYVTSLRRTVETIQPLVDRLGLGADVEADLREIHLGTWEGGLMRQKIADSDPIAVQLLEQQRWDVIPGAESSDDFGARVRAGIERITNAHPDQRVVVVIHGGTIAELLRQVTGSKPFAFLGADNASISSIVVAPTGSSLRCFNDISHLGATSGEMT